MIKKKSNPNFLLVPLALLILGCMVAYSNASVKSVITKPAKKIALNLAEANIIFKDTIKFIQSDSIILQPDKKLTTFEGDVILQQGTTIFKADKAVKNDSLNTFEAWGHVHINDADTTNIYADHLKYFGTPQLAELDGNVRLTDGEATLTTPSLDYDMTTNIGIYTEGGKVVNKKTVITSKEGEYDSGIKNVFFKKNVVVTDPAYNIKTDSLQYNTGTQIATFITMTHIKDSARRSIDTKEGYYNLKTGQAQFGQRPFINDDNKSTLEANEVYLDSSIARAEGNAIAVDSVRGTIIYANKIFQNRLNEAILATQNPVMIIKQNNDSIYVAADTLFSARLSDLYETPPPIPDTTTTLNNDNNEEVMVAITNTLEKDSATLFENNILETDTIPNIITKATLEKDSIDLAIANTLEKDSTENIIKENLLKGDSILNIAKKNILQNDSAVNLIDRNQEKSNNVIAEPATKNLQNAGGVVSVIKKDARIIAQDTVKAKATSDSTDRYFEAFHNVKIYSDSMQAVADSLFYSFRDSTFRLYKDPVVWGKESQITGDTILMHTKNKKPKWLEVFPNSFMISSTSDQTYNQIKASRLDAYFSDGNIDSVRAKGAPERIYFLQDDDSAYVGVQFVKADLMIFEFKNKQLYKVSDIRNITSTIYPIKQKNPDETKLEGFSWREALRPKTKYELFK